MSTEIPPRASEAANPYEFSADDVTRSVEGVSANPRDLTSNVPSVDELIALSELADKVSVTPANDTAGIAVDQDAADKLFTVGNPKSWVVTDPAERARLEIITDELLDDKSFAVKYDNINNLPGEVRAQVADLQDRGATFEAAVAQVATTAKARLKLSDDLEAMSGTKRSKAPEPAPAETTHPKKGERNDDRNRDRGTRGKGANSAPTTSTTTKPTPKPRAATNSGPATTTAPPKPNPTRVLSVEEVRAASKSASAPTPAPGEKSKTPPVASVADIRQGVMDALDRHYAAGGGYIDEKKGELLFAQDTEALWKALQADAVAHGLNPDSPEVHAEFDKIIDELDAEMEAKQKDYLSGSAPAEPTPPSTPTTPPASPKPPKPTGDTGDAKKAPTPRTQLEREADEIRKLVENQMQSGLPLDDPEYGKIMKTLGENHYIYFAAENGLDPDADETREQYEKFFSAGLLEDLRDLARQHGYTLPVDDPRNTPGSGSTTPPVKPAPPKPDPGSTKPPKPTTTPPPPPPINTKKTPKDPLNAAHNAYTQAFEDHLKNGGALDDEAFDAKTDALWENLETEFRAAAVRAGKDPDSDEMKAKFADMSQKLSEKIDAWEVQYGPERAQKLSLDIVDAATAMKDADKLKATDYLTQSAEIKALVEKMKEIDPANADKWQAWYDSTIVPDMNEAEGKISRVKLAMARAKMALSGSSTRGRSKAGLLLLDKESRQEYFGDAEKGRRRKIVAGVVGAAAVGTALYFAAKGVYEWGHADGVADAQAAGGTPKEVPVVPEAPPAPEVHHLSVHSGDNAWQLINDANGGNQDLTNSLFNNGQVSVTDASGNVRTTDLHLIHPGDTVNYTLPQPTPTGAGQVAQEAANNPNVEVLTPYDSDTGAGTVSYATLDHLHDLNIDVPDPDVFKALYGRVAEYNGFTPDQLTQLPVGQEINFPPQEELSEWIRQLNEAANKTTTK